MPAFSLRRTTRTLLAALLTVAGQAAAKAPNIIFIMADDLGYHDLGCYGQTKIQTPRIDRLAALGTRFTDVYSGSAVCAPARSTLMTGLHTGHTRIRGNFPAEGGLPDMNGMLRLPLSPEETTLASLLKSAGYRTAMTGKWGLGEEGTTGEPNKHGFDEWFGYLNQQHAHNYFPEFQWHNTARIEIAANRSGGRQKYSHDLHTAFALDFIRKAASAPEPFFLYLPYQIPHAKYEIPSLDIYQDKDWPKDAKVHAAMITRLDGDIGKFSDLLDELGIAPDTLIFFTSDNGAAQRWEGLFNSSHPLRGRKRDLYEGGIRVPMIVAGPGIPAGSTSNAAWYFPDLFPTFAALTDKAASAIATDGINILPTLRGEAQPGLRDRILYWEFHEGGFSQAVRLGDWKAVRRHGRSLELYNLSQDIGETENLAAGQPEIATSLEKAMTDSRRPSRHWPAPVDAAP